MDKLFELDKVSSNGDLPYSVEMVNEKVQFCIPNYDDIYNAIEIIARNTAELEVDESNVASMEHKAADIKKMADGIKKSATRYVGTYTEKLLGSGRGKTKVNGQVDNLYDILMSYYNALHEKTTAVRTLIKSRQETKEEATSEVKALTHTIICEVPVEMELSFLIYLSGNGIKYEVKEK